MALSPSTADLLAARDLALEPSPWLEVTQQRINQFAEATNDHQWIHVDPERARRSPFGTTIAHGYLTMSLLPYLVNQVLDLSAAGMVINYGLESLRFPAPLPSGSRIRLKARIIGCEKKTGGVLIRLGAEIEIEGAAKPALVAELLYLAFGG